jgi:flavodoxin
MKRFLTICFSFLMIFSLTACGGNQESASPSPASQQEETQNTQAASSSEEGNSSQDNNGGSTDSKILIAYFTAAENSGVDAVSSASYSTVNGTAVGRLRAVADMIQAEIGGELFSIQTSVVYPADGGELIDYASKEQEDNARPELTSQIENLDQYETVFVGFPTWWYDMPQALYSFFDAYDFSGKTIIPFNVHNGSRFSGTIDTIQELEPDAEVITDGFTVSERDVSDASGDVAEWLGGLGY